MSFFWEIGIYLIEAIFHIGIGYATENQNDTDISEFGLSFWIILGVVVAGFMGIMLYWSFS